MTIEEEMRSYKARWEAVNAVRRAELRAASYEDRWLKLNFAYGLGKALGFTQDEASEMEVYLKWAKIKDRLAEKSD